MPSRRREKFAERCDPIPARPATLAFNESLFRDRTTMFNMEGKRSGPLPGVVELDSWIWEAEELKVLLDHGERAAKTSAKDLPSRAETLGLLEEPFESLKIEHLSHLNLREDLQTIKCTED